MPASARPSWPAGTGRLSQFEVVLERIARGRPERSIVLTGLRGVGKTVLLNSFRSMALQRLWGTGKIEARPEQSIRRPVAGALHMAVRELAPRHRAPDRIDEFLGVLKAFAPARPEGAARAPAPRTWASTCLRSRGRADSGDMEIDLIELFTDAASVAGDLGVGIALFIDEMQDVPAPDISALCAAVHELSQTGGPLIVVGAGLPHLPSVLSASKSYSERLFRYVRIDRLDRAAADQALLAPAEREEVDFEPDALDALYGRPTATRTSSRRTARSPGTWPRHSPVTAADVAVAAPEAEAELAVGFFGSRYERATPAEREYMRAMARLGDDPVPDRAGRRRARPQAVQPVPGPGRPDQEGPHLQLGARPDRVYRPALRPVPARPAPLSPARPPARRLGSSGRISDLSRAAGRRP